MVKRKRFFEFVDRVVAKKEITHASFRVLYFLAARAREDGKVWHATRMIASATGMPDRSVRLCLRKLQALGVIKGTMIYAGQRLPSGQHAAGMRMVHEVQWYWGMTKEEMGVKNSEELSKIDYYEYLKTEAWQVKRMDHLRKSGFKCQICNNGKTILDVHHRTYSRLGKEKYEDLIVLCRECHGRFHDKLNEVEIDE